MDRRVNAGPTIDPSSMKSFNFGLAGNHLPGIKGGEDMSTKTGADRSLVIGGESRYDPPEDKITVTANIEEQMVKYCMMLSVEAEEWKLNSGKIGGVLNMTPTQLAMLNSVRTSKSEEERIKCAGEFIKDIVNVPNASTPWQCQCWVLIVHGVVRSHCCGTPSAFPTVALVHDLAFHA